MEKAKRALVLTAHADDCEFFAGGFVASLAQSGYEVYEVIATDNSRGSFELETRALVAQSRDVEARAAAKIIGKKDVEFLGYPDGFLDETPKNELRRIFMERIRKIAPDILLSFDPFAPFEPHPDHRAVATAAIEAVSFCNLPLYHPEQVAAGFKPCYVPTRYWFAKNNMYANTTIDITATIDKKIEALCAQTSQMRMTITDIKQSVLATGKHEELLPFLEEDHYAPAVDMMIRMWGANAGKKAGYEYGELFRREDVGDLFGGAIE